jgi:hypothetical protein
MVGAGAGDAQGRVSHEGKEWFHAETRRRGDGAAFNFGGGFPKAFERNF